MAINTTEVSESNRLGAGTTSGFVQPPFNLTGRSSETIYVLDPTGETQDSLKATHWHVQSIHSVKQFVDIASPDAAGCLIVEGSAVDGHLHAVVDQVWMHAMAFPLIYTSTDLHYASVFNASRAGVHAFVPKPLDTPEILKAIDFCLDQDQQGEPSAREVRRKFATLTQRQREVL